MAETEDVDYTVSDFATPEKEDEPDEDQAYKGVLLSVQQYLDDAITEHNTFDVIDLNQPGKMNPTQQIAVHKLVVNHLRSVRSIVNNKLKELE